MRKTFTILLCILVFCLVAKGQEKKPVVSFGVNWGYSAKIFDAHKFIYYDRYGSLVAKQDAGFSFASNGYILAELCLHISKKSGVCILSGYESISKGRNEIPLQIRYCHTSQGYDRDGSLFFAGGGVGFPLNSEAVVPSACGLLGGGYRFALTKRMSIDLTGSFKLTFDRPNLKDNSTGGYIPQSNIQHNNAMYAALNIGLGLNF